jgi:hypothetical protein
MIRDGITAVGTTWDGRQVQGTRTHGGDNPPHFGADFPLPVWDKAMPAP